MTTAVMEPSGRRRRVDAGPGGTRRDADALGWIAEMFTVRMDTLSVLLARMGDPQSRVRGRVSASMTARTVRRWVDAGWVHVKVIGGYRWVLPTAAGYRLADIEPKASPDLPPDVVVMEPWQPRLRMLPHVHATGLVRLHLEPQLPEGQEWVSERQMRHELAELKRAKGYGKLIRHIFDGAIEDPDGKRVALEVELSLKDPKLLAQTVRRPVTESVIEVRYYAPARHLATLTHHIKESNPRKPTTTYLLPDVGIDFMED